MNVLVVVHGQDVPKILGCVQKVRDQFLPSVVNFPFLHMDSSVVCFDCAFHCLELCNLSWHPNLCNSHLKLSTKFQSRGRLPLGFFLAQTLAIGVYIPWLTFNEISLPKQLYWARGAMTRTENPLLAFDAHIGPCTLEGIQVGASDPPSPSLLLQTPKFQALSTMIRNHLKAN